MIKLAGHRRPGSPTRAVRTFLRAINLPRQQVQSAFPHVALLLKALEAPACPHAPAATCAAPRPLRRTRLVGPYTPTRGIASPRFFLVGVCLPRSPHLDEEDLPSLVTLVEVPRGSAVAKRLSSPWYRRPTCRLYPDGLSESTRRKP